MLTNISRGRRVVATIIIILSYLFNPYNLVTSSLIVQFYEVCASSYRNELVSYDISYDLSCTGLMAWHMAWQDKRHRDCMNSSHTVIL